LLELLFSSVFVFLQLKNSRSHKTNGNNFRFCFSCETALQVTHRLYCSCRL